MTDLFSDRPNPWVGPLYPLDSDFERAGELADLQFLHGDPDYDPLFDPDFVRDDINRDGISLEEATVLARLRVSPLREPRRTGLQSSDPVLSVCVHELARALEEFARKQYVAIYAGDAEFETAAIEIAEKLSAYKCQLKGV